MNKYLANKILGRLHDEGTLMIECNKYYTLSRKHVKIIIPKDSKQGKELTKALEYEIG